MTCTCDVIDIIKLLSNNYYHNLQDGQNCFTVLYSQYTFNYYKTFPIMIIQIQFDQRHDNANICQPTLYSLQYIYIHIYNII